MESRPTELWLQPCELPRRQLSATGRKLLRRALTSRNIQLPEHQLSLPGLELIELLDSSHGIGVSISHCPGLVAVALGTGALGVDCEPGKQTRDWAELAEYSFTPGEAREVTRLSDKDNATAFLRHWVCKEAFVKFEQGSVFGDLNRLSLTADGTFQIDTTTNTTVRLWWGTYLGFQLALCQDSKAASTPVIVNSDGNPLSMNFIEILQSSPRQASQQAIS
ncbi:4'-phosphopantetheinyl transferase family protein [Pseudohalioglobus lutimaris]|uniref:4'-phosphopantetheinyl transferase domain-containing protein n=1 Tax=Pseudohalioglobus lutimaris TaxID=1737061 RepID=A0A2N5WZI5_9GAMM|nr:4'-phosphopantetheinyl transferase superfamily protein [Pseudohalioglobus lutimaris]PLW67650.1 hypothetical protein C0039_15710 [Pseudohalioglobus lutimaris]